jgi:hypothetical protein
MSGRALNGYTEEKAIKRLLRRSGSGEYFKDGDWTGNPSEASTFADAVQVAEICARYGLKDVELALRYDAAAVDLFCTEIC